MTTYCCKSKTRHQSDFNIQSQPTKINLTQPTSTEIRRPFFEKGSRRVGKLGILPIPLLLGANFTPGVSCQTCNHLPDEVRNWPLFWTKFQTGVETTFGMFLTDFGAPKSDNKYTFIGRRVCYKKTCFFWKARCRCSETLTFEDQSRFGRSPEPTKFKKKWALDPSKITLLKNVKKHNCLQTLRAPETSKMMFSLS